MGWSEVITRWHFNDTFMTFPPPHQQIFTDISTFADFFFCPCAFTWLLGKSAGVPCSATPPTSGQSRSWFAWGFPGSDWCCGGCAPPRRGTALPRRPRPAADPLGAPASAAAAVPGSHPPWGRADSHAATPPGDSRGAVGCRWQRQRQKWRPTDGGGPLAEKIPRWAADTVGGRCVGGWRVNVGRCCCCCWSGVLGPGQLSRTAQAAAGT